MVRAAEASGVRGAAAIFCIRPPIPVHGFERKAVAAGLRLPTVTTIATNGDKSLRVLTEQYHK